MGHAWWTFVLLMLLGFAVGVFGALVGAGGGFILSPVLLLLYPTTSPATLTSISIAVVFFNALSGSAAYARQRRIDLRVGSALGAATLPGAVAGALLVGQVPRHAFDVTMALVLAIMSGAGTLTHLAQGSYGVGNGLRRALALSVGVIGGAQLGARLSVRASAPLIQRLLSLALLAIAIRLAVGA